MKDEILNIISMQDILDKYGIENNGKMFRCPFHGEDKHPSAKIYKNSYCCFCCASAGDTIRFVERLFNLSFKDAMQKINYDFALGLNNNYVDYKRLNQLKSIENAKKKRKQELTKKYCELCDIKHKYEKVIDIFSKKITIKNWETMTEVISNFQMKIFKIEDELEDIDNLLSSRN